MSNLPPGAEWQLAMQEAALDAYEWALDRAWRLLEEDGDVPLGVGWRIADEEQDRNGAFVFYFEDDGGYTYTATVGYPDDQEYEPPHWYD